jgi:hypothetical protein
VTPAEVAAFQRLHVGPDGQRLLADGVLGPKTQWAYDIEALPEWRQRIVFMALRFVGVTEKTPNRGDEIDAWLKACRVEPGNPYCAAFASMCLRAAGFDIREASCHELAGKLWLTEHPLPGDLLFLLRPDGTGHVDIVTGIGDEHFVSVCGGNVNDGVRAGLRSVAGRTFRRARESGVPEALASLPWLGAKTV